MLHILMSVLLTLALLTMFVCSESRTLYIKDEGILPMQKGDVALTFYITVKNTGHYSVGIDVEMYQCCLDDPEPEYKDCKSMVLIGGHQGMMHPDDSRNLTLIYPNMYLTDRVGTCTVDIIHTGNHYLRHKIAFDTRIYPRNTWIPVFLRKYIYGMVVYHCTSIDQDRLQSCRPVDCIQKYNGYRNYFNTTYQRCQPATKCSSSIKETIFIPEWNGCKDRYQVLLEHDRSALSAHNDQSMLRHLTEMDIQNSICNHGHWNTEFRVCICDAGWRSTSTQELGGQYSSQNIPVMCNIAIQAQPLSLVVRIYKYFTTPKWNAELIATVVILSISLILSIVLLLMCAWEKIKNRKAYSVNRKTSLQKLAESLGNASKGGSASHLYEYAKVLKANSALTENELELSVGDWIRNLEKTSSVGWWKGTCHGITGVFPSKCVKFYKAGECPVDSDSDTN